MTGALGALVVSTIVARSPVASSVTADPIRLEVCSRQFLLECSDPGHRDLLHKVFGKLTAGAKTDSARTFDLGRLSGKGDGYLLEAPGESARTIGSRAELIYEVDKDLTIALQRARPDLLFVHAAAVELEGRAILLCGPSGTGKSTTAFVLLHHGFGYLSDELAPIDLENGVVHTYAHALCLKSAPAAPYRLPAATLDLGETLHLPVPALPGACALRPLPLHAIAFLRRGGSAHHPGLRPLSTACAAAHLLSCTLNALAHHEQGADAALAISRRAPGFELETSDLPAAAKALRAMLLA